MLAIQDTANFFGLPMKATDEDVRSSDKDLGLDVLSRVDLGDERAGGLYVLTQCATGLKWYMTKRGEPSLELWAGLIGWDGMRTRAIAIPYRVEEAFEMKRYSLRCEAVVLDRDRLIMSNPDQNLDSQARIDLISWCAYQVERVPEHHVG